MAAERQIEANRPNAEESTGPKARVPAPSRRHALRLLTMALPAATELAESDKSQVMK